jgi:DNA-binding transcriptional regulator YdaS (Cro superfamily)
VKKFLEWWNASSVEDHNKLADLIGTSTTYLRSHVIAGRRPMTAAYAATVERALKMIGRGRKQALPVVDRRDLCETCRHCPFAARER